MFVLLGLNHNSAPLSVRERVAFGDGDLSAALNRLRGYEAVAECMILSTCNRVELVVRPRPGFDGLAAIRDFLGHRGLNPGDLQAHVYHYEGRDAIRHLFQVACGLDSMILGEPQILGQLKQAFAAADEAKTIGPLLGQLLRRTFHTAKQVRRETGISRYPVSVAYAAVELARKIFGQLEGRSVLVLGAGKMCELTVRHLRGNGMDEVIVASRTFQRASLFAERFGGQALAWDRFRTALAEVDVVVCGTAAPTFVLERSDVEQAIRERRHRRLFLIDIAVPRDVDPAVNDLDNVYLYDVDDLQGVVDRNLEERKRAAQRARRDVERHVDNFVRWSRELDVKPTILALRRKFESHAREELERFTRRHGGELDADGHLAEELARGIVHKALHAPLVGLKRMAASGDPEALTALYREIFDLRETDGAGDVARRTVDDGAAVREQDEE